MKLTKGFQKSVSVVKNVSPINHANSVNCFVPSHGTAGSDDGDGDGDDDDDDDDDDNDNTYNYSADQKILVQVVMAIIILVLFRRLSRE